MDTEEVYCSDNPSPPGSENDNPFGSDDEVDMAAAPGQESLSRPLDTSPAEADAEDSNEDEDASEESNEDEDPAGDNDVAPSRQRQIIKLMEEEQPGLVEGDLWYLIDSGWLRRWKQYVKYDISNGVDVVRPGPISNEDLVDDQGRVHQNLIEYSHYSIISKLEWQNLVSWYGGGPEVARPVISTGMYNKSVEVRQLNLQFLKSSDLETTVWHSFSKVTPLKTVIETVCPLLGVEEENVRMWDFINKGYSQLLEDTEKTLTQCTIINNQHLLLEEKLESGEWPARPVGRATGYSSGYRPSTSYSSGSTWSSSSTTGSSWNNSSSWSSPAYNRGKEPSDPGICGLSNLGNTCFMNSSLQSLANCAQLTRYCISDEYKAEINTDNPLGTGGKLVEQYASLLKNMWSGEYKFIAPREFKQKLETFAPQFEGMQQHDSQELLAYLLDGLHEDLNRVKKKPFIELKEADGRPDAIVAQEAWDNHLARNDSVIVDWFLGQLKSTLVCPAEGCDRVSITFDPTMYLSLPLPVATTRTLKNLVVVPADPAVTPTKYSVVLNKTGNVQELKKELATLSGVPVERLVATEIFGNKIYKMFSDKEAVENFGEKDVIRFYEVAQPARSAAAEEEEEEEEEEEAHPVRFRYKPTPPPNPADVIYVQVILRKKDPPKTYYYGSSESFTVVGFPNLFAVRRDISYEEMHAKVAQWLSRYVKDPSILELPPYPEPTPEPEQPEQDADGDAVITEAEGEDTTPPAEEALPMEVDTPVVDAAAQPMADDSTSVGEEMKEEQGEEQGEDDAAEEEEEEEQEEEPAFILEVLDIGARRRVRDVFRGDSFNFRDREMVSVTFSAESFQENYSGPATEEVVLHSSAAGEEEDEEDEEDACDLSECLELFTVEEQLGSDDMWYCNKCKDHKQATKKFDLWKLPPLLVIHLKRFSYRNRYKRDKLDTLVRFPLKDLDLSQYLLSESDTPAKYDLMAVSNHFGALGGGHYTAFAKNANDEKWYKFDDSHVSPVNESSVCSTAAYVLFYRRQDATDSGEKIQYTPPTAPAKEEDEEDTEDDEAAADDDKNGDRDSMAVDPVDKNVEDPMNIDAQDKNAPTPDPMDGDESTATDDAIAPEA